MRQCSITLKRIGAEGRYSPSIGLDATLQTSTALETEMKFVGSLSDQPRMPLNTITAPRQSRSELSDNQSEKVPVRHDRNAHKTFACVNTCLSQRIASHRFDRDAGIAIYIHTMSAFASM